jgi:hypothetical protein
MIAKRLDIVFTFVGDHSAFRTGFMNGFWEGTASAVPQEPPGMRASAPEVRQFYFIFVYAFAAARRASLGSGGFIKASTNVR